MPASNALLNEAGFIFGASATSDGLNVITRLRKLEAMWPLPGGIAADIGCGEGAYTVQIQRSFSQTFAFDILPEKLARLQQNPGMSSSVTAACASVEAVPLPTGSVDAAFLIEVLDHVPFVKSALDEVARILKAQGVCYISVPNRLFPLETHPIKWMQRLVHPFFFPFLPWIPALHRRLATARVFSPNDLTDAARESGLELVRLGCMMPPLERRVKWMRRLLHGLEGTLAERFGSSLLVVLRKRKAL